MKRLLKIFPVLVILAGALFLTPYTSYAQYPIDNIGQSYSNGAPRWDAGLPGNYSTPNGVMGDGSGVIDYVNKIMWLPDDAETAGHQEQWPANLTWGGNRILGYRLDSAYNRISDTPDFVIGQPDAFSNSQRCDRYSIGTLGQCGIAWSPSLQYLFVPDEQNNRVMIWDFSKGIHTGMPAKYVIGQVDFKSKVYGNSASDTSLAKPDRCAWDEVNKRLFINDNDNIRIVTVNCANGFYNNMPFEHVLLQTGFGATILPATATASNGLFLGQLYYWSAKQWLISVQLGFNRVLIFDLSPGIVNGMNAKYVLGQADFVSLYANRNNGVSSPGNNGLYLPNNVAVDEVRNIIWIAEWGNNRIVGKNVSAGIVNGAAWDYVIGQGGSFTTQTAALSQNGLNFPGGLTFNKKTNKLNISDELNERMVVQNTTDLTNLSSFSEVYGGQTSYTVNAYATISPVNAGGLGASIYNYGSTNGISIDKTHHLLWVCDAMNNRVLGFPLNANGTPNGKMATVVLGQADFVSGQENRGGSTGQNTLLKPVTVFFDITRNWLWVTDNSRVLVYDLSGGITNGMNATYVIGQPDFVTITPGITNAKMSGPWGVYVTAAGIAYIGDANRVVTVDASHGLNNGQIFTHVLGQADFTHNTANRGGSVGINTLNLATGIFIDESANLLFIAEYNNKRVSVYNIAPGITDGMNASYFLGQADGITAATLTSQMAVGKALWLAKDTTNNILYVGCQSLSEVVGFDLKVLATGMNASKIFGRPDFIATGPDTLLPPNTTKFRINQPQGIAFDNDNRLLLVADQWNRIIFYKDSNLTITAINHAAAGPLMPMEIYPNPATNKIIVQCPNPGLQKIVIADMTGRIVYSSAAPLNENDTQMIEVLNLSNGIYTMMAETKTAIFSQKFEIMR